MSVSGKKKPGRTEREQQLQKQLSALKSQALEQGIKVRVEPGNFQSGYCLVEEQQMIIINRRLTLEERVQMLSRELACRTEQSAEDKLLGGTSG